MPNKYTKVPLKIITDIPKDNKIPAENYTHAITKILIAMMPREPELIVKTIKKIQEEL